MQFLTPDECKRWLASRWQPSLDRASSKASLPYSKVPSRLHWISRELSWDSPVLLWVQASDIGPSNWHLYYRLRESYGDRRSIDDAPGHLCLNYEAEDLATLINLTMLNGWDAAYIPELDYVSLTFSHHGFIDVFSTDEKLVEDVRANAADAAP